MVCQRNSSPFFLNFPGTVRPIRRRTFPASSAPGKGIQWQWLDDTGWSSYDLSAGDIVEGAYSQGKSSLDLSQTNCKLPYVVDFTNMAQVRKGSGFQRKIQRITLNPSYPKVQTEEDAEETVLPSGSVDCPVATVTSSSVASASKDPTSSVVICIETAPSTVTRPNALSTPTDDVAETSTSTNPTPATSSARVSKRASGKRTGSRKAVAATSGVQATVAWSTPPGSSVASSSTVSSTGGNLARSSSVPGGNLARSSSVPGIGPEVTTVSSATSTVVSSGPTISHSATTSCLAAAAAAPSRMTRYDMGL